MHLPPLDPDTGGRALKAAGAILAAGVAAVFAQAQIPGLGAAANIGVVAVLAGLLFRYVFRLLEDYRADLAVARARTDALEDDLRRLGRSSARKEEAIRELTEYGHRLRVFLIASGASAEELPEQPEITPNGPEAN
jgi:hypothetical protein